MSESKPLSAEEKKRLLRERRAAKMAGGKATNRLNTILTQGSSVKSSSVTSVLDKEDSPSPSPSGTTGTTVGSDDLPTATTTALDIHNNHDDDPDIQDISAFSSPSPDPEKLLNSTQDIDDMFTKIFSGADGATGPGEDQFAQMMKMFGQAGAGASAGAGADGPSPEDFFAGTPVQNEEEHQYQREVAAYNLYYHKQWKFRFLIIRFSFILINFFYHFLTIPTFKASSYSYIRDISYDTTTTTSFIVWFTTGELITIATYFLISMKYDLFKTTTENSIFIKILSFGSSFLPQLQQYRPLVVRCLSYYELLGIFLADLSLVVVLFGLLSIS
ncbi:Golgi to ER traffic protein 2 [Scheffersomyces amazonensis]|uniref:Golgi to ER traffic protein 2 n=1 Tax=Scheffersomyces amazonensis TaxID=1078765 RepID=UPI00315DAD70